MTGQLPYLAPALPEIFLVCAAMALLLFGVFRGEGSTRTVSTLAVVSLAIAAYLVLRGEDGRLLTFNGLFIVDGFAVFAKLLVLLGSALGIVMSVGYIEREGIARFEYPILFLLATVGMMMMISANDLISLYVGLELQSLALYVVAAFRRDSGTSAEAGLKYFVLGSLSSGMMLYGASMIYGFAGTTSFETLAALFLAGETATLTLIVGIVFLSVGLAFKISAVPFHMWTPDVYEGAPTPVTAFFAVAPKIAAMALFIRVLVGPFGELVAQWQQIIIACAILSMALGSFAAIAQRNIKRLMAYSSIGHVGFALVGVAAGTAEGIRGVLLYLAIYLAMNVGTFAVILCMRVKGRMVEEIGDLAGLNRTHPMLALALAILMFAMAGIPPTAGFFAKLYVFLAAVDAGLTWLAVVAVVLSVVSAFYYVRIIRLMYFDEPAVDFDRPVGASLSTVLTVSTLFTLFFFAYPSPILDAAGAAAGTLFAAQAEP